MKCVFNQLGALSKRLVLKYGSSKRAYRDVMANQNHWHVKARLSRGEAAAEMAARPSARPEGVARGNSSPYRRAYTYREMSAAALAHLCLKFSWQEMHHHESKGVGAPSGKSIMTDAPGARSVLPA